MTVERIRDYDQPGWNAGYREGQAERTALATENAYLLMENARLLGIVSRATRYVLQPANLVDVAARGTAVFGKRWQEITGLKTQPAKDAT